MADFDRDDLDRALDQLDLRRGDVLFSHANIGFFGRPDGLRTADELASLFCDRVFDRIGEEGTLVVPTFTYSFPRREIFDPIQSASRMGAFAEWIRRHPKAKRSLDPCYSVAALGGRSDEMTANVPENSFGPASFFDRFIKADGRIFNLNFDAGSTFVHYVERELRVPYRFDKTFEGEIRLGGAATRGRSTIWVRYLSDDALEAKFEPFDALARDTGIYRTAALGRGRMGIIAARDCFNLIAETLPRRPYFLTKAESLGIATPKIVPETQQ
jgi:aminoglycoside 3-N-acetyltransferase